MHTELAFQPLVSSSCFSASRLQENEVVLHRQKLAGPETIVQLRSGGDVAKNPLETTFIFKHRLALLKRLPCSSTCIRS
eukprot:4192315-Amphidinium_carterae.1